MNALRRSLYVIPDYKGDGEKWRFRLFVPNCIVFRRLIFYNELKKVTGKNRNLII